MVPSSSNDLNDLNDLRELLRNAWEDQSAASVVNLDAQTKFRFACWAMLNELCQSANQETEIKERASYIAGLTSGNSSLRAGFQDFVMATLSASPTEILQEDKVLSKLLVGLIDHDPQFVLALICAPQNTATTKFLDICKQERLFGNILISQIIHTHSKLSREFEIEPSMLTKSLRSLGFSPGVLMQLSSNLLGAYMASFHDIVPKLESNCQQISQAAREESDVKTIDDIYEFEAADSPGLDYATIALDANDGTAITDLNDDDDINDPVLEALRQRDDLSQRAEQIRAMQDLLLDLICQAGVKPTTSVMSRLVESVAFDSSVLSSLREIESSMEVLDHISLDNLSDYETAETILDLAASVANDPQASYNKETFKMQLQSLIRANIIHPDRSVLVEHCFNHLNRLDPNAAKQLAVAMLRGETSNGSISDEARMKIFEILGDDKHLVNLIVNEANNVESETHHHYNLMQIFWSANTQESNALLKAVLSHPNLRSLAFIEDIAVNCGLAEHECLDIICRQFQTGLGSPIEAKLISYIDELAKTANGDQPIPLVTDLDSLGKGEYLAWHQKFAMSKFTFPEMN